MDGEVVRISRKEPRDPGSVSGMGIRFTNLDDKAKQAIDFFLNPEFPKAR